MVRTIPVNQIFARLDLTTRRYFATQFPLLFLWRLKVKATEQKINKDARGPIFTRRRVCRVELRNNNTLIFNILNERREVPIPIDWNYDKTNSQMSHLWMIHLHAMEYLEDVDNGLFQLLINQWIEGNSAYQRRYWQASWNSYALSIRCVVWMQQYVVRRNELNQEFLMNFLASLSQQLTFLSLNLEKDLTGNHLVKNAKALVWGSHFLDGVQSDGWRKNALSLIQKTLDLHVLPDGMQFELSPSYHNQVLADLLEFHYILGDSDDKIIFEETIQKMAQVAVDLTHPDGWPALFNDGGSSMAYKTEELVRVMMQIGLEVPQRNRAFSYSSAGYSGFYTDTNYFLLKHGKLAPNELPGHGHGDIFSFELSLDNKRIVVDKGVLEYESGKSRENSRSTASHNTLNIDGLDQCEFWGSFRSGRKPLVESEVSVSDSRLEINGNHDGYQRLRGKPVHCRKVIVSFDMVKVIDTVKGGEGQLAQSRLLFHPECKLQANEGILIIRRGDIELYLETYSPICILQTTWHPDFGYSYPAQQVVLEYGPIPGVWEFKIYRI